VSAGRFVVTVALLHDAPLLMVIDLAQGPTGDFEIPVTKGATAGNANFNFETIHIHPGRASTASRTWPKLETVELQYGDRYGKPSETTKSFPVIHHTNPPVMAAAISVNALDATGNEIKNSGALPPASDKTLAPPRSHARRSSARFPTIQSV
jgi:hypothetical protein